MRFSVCIGSPGVLAARPTREKKKKKKKEKKKKKKNFCHPGYKNDGIHNVRVYVKMQFCLNSEFTVNEGISAKGELNYGL